MNPDEAKLTEDEQAAFDRVVSYLGAEVDGPFEPNERPDAILPELAPISLPTQMEDGLAFVLGGSVEEEPIWGRGTEDVAWSHGEPTGLFGPDGVGKTTLGHLIAFGLLAIQPKVLGMHIEPADAMVLYVSADRPHQSQRAMWRLAKDLDKTAFAKLKTGLFVWRGPLPFDLVKEPAKLAEFAADYGASHVLLDSLGMIVPRLTEDETGSALAQAFTVCSVGGIELLWLLHPRKANAENRRPNTLADVYGSRWITASTGSVFSLWGDAGDPVVEFKHLKPPRNEVGPFMVEIDHAAGTMAVESRERTCSAFSETHATVSRRRRLPDRWMVRANGRRSRRLGGSWTGSSNGRSRTGDRVRSFAVPSLSRIVTSRPRERGPNDEHGDGHGTPSDGHGHATSTTRHTRGNAAGQTVTPTVTLGHAADGHANAAPFRGVRVRCGPGVDRHA